jgi:tetratricopeptide (TPR) repeat protein
MSSAATPTRGHWRAPVSRLLPRAVIAVIVLLLLALVLMCGVAMFGLVAGEEFSPDTFVQRNFYYYEVPLLGWQVSPVFRSERKAALVLHLRQQKMLPALPRDEPRWHFVAAHRGQKYLTGDANILCTYFDIEQDDENLWLKWTKSQPELAAILWPAIAEVARAQHYPFVPDMMQLAAEADDPPTFQQALDQLLAGHYAQLAANHYDLTAYDQAIRLYTQALSHAPNDQAALTGRADAYQAVGQLKKAAADRKKARQLAP